MSVIYRGPGRYVAVCNNADFSGHYLKAFDVPLQDPNCNNGGPGFTAEEMQHVEASWYFLNRVDFVACIDAVYPLEIFTSLREVLCDTAMRTS